MKKIKIVEVKSELGAGTRGASLGIDAIKTAALDYESDFFKRYPPVSVATVNELLLDPIKYKNAKHIDGILTMYERISAELQQIFAEDEFPLVLSGDHSNAGGTVAGIKEAFPNKRLGVIWIDAHADIHSPYTTPSGNMHGMPLAIVLGEDNLDVRSNEPSPDVVEMWEKLKHVGGVSPKVKYEDLIFIGVRDTEDQEDYVLQKNKVKNYTVAEVREKTIDKVVEEVYKQLEACDIIYISFDVDSMDTSVSVGTGTPVPGGLLHKEAEQLVLKLLENDKVCSFEIVEVNPTLDTENRMAEAAFEILQKATNQIEENVIEDNPEGALN